MCCTDKTHVFFSNFASITRRWDQHKTQLVIKHIRQMKKTFVFRCCWRSAGTTDDNRCVNCTLKKITLLRGFAFVSRLNFFGSQHLIVDTRQRLLLITSSLWNISSLVTQNCIRLICRTSTSHGISTKCIALDVKYIK